MSRRSEARRMEGIDENGFDITPKVETSTKSAKMAVIETYAKLNSLRKVAKQLDMTYQQVRAIINEHNAGLKGSASK
jgi:molybdenum-dependent DNA-binding transcriptional regulator ModE